MRVVVRYFASLREVLGASEVLDVPAGQTVGGLRDMLLARSSAHAGALDRQRALRCALNQILCEESAGLGEADEVAFFPPVTGG